MTLTNNTGVDVHTLLNLIRTRRSFSLKQLSPDPIDLDAVQLMLQAANWAPSHGHTEPWRFTVFAGDGRRGLSDAFGRAYRQIAGEKTELNAEQAQRDRVWLAPVWISVGMEPGMNDRGEPRWPEWEEMIAVGSAVQNMLVVAASLGLGAKWTSGEVSRHPLVAEFIGLQPPAKLLGFIYTGRPAIPWYDGKRRPLEEKVRWITGSAEED